MVGACASTSRRPTCRSSEESSPSVTSSRTAKPLGRPFSISTESVYPAGGFVQVYDLPTEEGGAWKYEPYPWVSAVAGTNYCQIGLDVDRRRGRIVVMSVLDSIGKGGAHVGVENMNRMLGLAPEMGLTRRGLHP